MEESRSRSWQHVLKIAHENVMSTSFSYCYLKMAVKTCLVLKMLIDVVVQTVC